MTFQETVTAAAHAAARLADNDEHSPYGALAGILVTVAETHYIDLAENNAEHTARMVSWFAGVGADRGAELLQRIFAADFDKLKASRIIFDGVRDLILAKTAGT